MPSLSTLRGVWRVTVNALRSFGFGASTDAGVVLLVVGHPPFTSWYMAMGLFLVIGGALCTCGVLTDRWMGELLGLPLVASAMTVFAALTYRSTHLLPDPGPMVGMVSILLFVGYAGLLGARWVEILHLARAATADARRRRRVR